MKKIIFVLMLLGLSSTGYAAPQRSMIVDKDERVATIDGSTHAINVIDYAHHEVHAGSHFYVANYTTLGNDATLGFALTTSDTAKYVHMSWEIESTQPTTFEIFEGATIASAGTSVTPFNNNRNSATTSTVVLSSGATVANAVPNYGTKIYGERFGYADTPSKGFGGSSESATEIILKRNTVYFFSIWSQAAGNRVSFDGHWYEHTDKL
jgi:hypothetical protein